MKRILVLFHNKSIDYLVEHLMQRWVMAGYEVIEHIGMQDIPEADLVFLHNDLTVVANDFIECVKDHPNVINRHVLDISRRTYSQNLLKKEDDYNGWIIIKTNANYGGVPEKRMQGLSRQRTNWLNVDMWNPLEYPVMKHKRDIDADVWNNPGLVVEKYFPEIENGLFHVRYWAFLGDKTYSGRLGAKSPIVKFGNAVAEEDEVEVPQELHEWREKLKMDYGRFDFVMHKGQPVLIDVNKTMGAGDSMESYKAKLDWLAAGIDYYLK